jgi:REP element-mobilizing transposase RayT
VARAIYEEPLFRDNRDRRRFVALLKMTVGKLGWEIWAYCLMSTHYHLVAATPSPNLARGIQRLNGRYAQSFNRRWDRFGALFAERYTSVLIDSEEYFSDACRYVLNNPVKAGLCESADRWPWSGGRALADMSEGLTPELRPAERFVPS